MIRENELRIRNVSADICSLFEDLLDRFDLTVPSKDREGCEDEARIYGEPYSELEDNVTEILVGLAEELKENPDITINADEY